MKIAELEQFGIDVGSVRNLLKNARQDCLYRQEFVSAVDKMDNLLLDIETRIMAEAYYAKEKADV